jgi:hypothetical protein
MDMTDASAMTEASGLTSDQERIEHASEAIRDMTDDMTGNSAPLAPRSRSLTEPLADHLRRMTLAAPLHSLVIAFLLGAFVGRRY